jgi:hypothetical protein
MHGPRHDPAPSGTFRRVPPMSAPVIGDDQPELKKYYQIRHNPG